MSAGKKPSRAKDGHGQEDREGKVVWVGVGGERPEEAVEGGNRRGVRAVFALLFVMRDS